MEVKYVLAAALVCASVAGCTIVDSSSIVTGVQRAPIPSSQVRIYRVPPAEYEEVAVISARAGHDFKNDQSLMNSAVERLKEEAGAVGANGVLLSAVDQRDNPSVTSTYGTATAYGNNGASATAYGNGISVSRGDTYTKIAGLAILVP